MFTPALKFIIWLTLMLFVVLLGILMHKYPKSRFVYSLSYIISGIALVIYPGILSAGIMGFASLTVADTAITPANVLFFLFYAVTMLQPVTYIICLVTTLYCFSKKKNAVTISLLPYIAPCIASTVILLV